MVQIKEIVSTGAEAVKLYAEVQQPSDWVQIGFYVLSIGTTSYILYQFVAPTIRRITWKPNKNLLQGKVAIVTGGSRGVGKGIALGLAEAGCTVYVTGRTEIADQGVLPGSINETAIQVNGLGGTGIAVVCDHSKDEDVERLFDRVLREQGKVDILVNNAFQSPPGFDIAGNPEKLLFWEGGAKLWDSVITVGLRSHYIASCYAAKVMTAQKNGVIINISSEGAQRYLFYLAYGVGKCALDRMTHDMALELRNFHVAAISLWPGLVKTERNLERSDYIREKWKVDLEGKGEYPIYTGRAIAALASDPSVMKYSGKSITNQQAAQMYGFTDLDGRQPASPTNLWFYYDHVTSNLRRKLHI